MNDYQVEIQVKKGKQAVCLFTRVYADSEAEAEAKIKGKRFANSLGRWHGYQAQCSCSCSATGLGALGCTASPALSSFPNAIIVACRIA